MSQITKWMKNARERAFLEAMAKVEQQENALCACGNTSTTWEAQGFKLIPVCKECMRAEKTCSICQADVDRCLCGIER